jgi:hypothetical protein
LHATDILQLLINHYWQDVKGRSSLADLNTDDGWYEALIHFIDYAYERNVPDVAIIYRKASKVALRILMNRQNWSEQTQLAVWEKFIEILSKHRVGANKKLNPLAPEYNNNRNAAKFAWYICNEEHPTLAMWTFNMIRMNNISDCHKKIKTIRGVGNKIASYYMRDIFWLGTGLNPNTGFYKNLNDLYLIQPVDTWIRKAASAIGCEKENDLEIAKHISSFEYDFGITPGGANIGFWMLGAYYLNCDEDFNFVVKALFNPSTISKEKALDISRCFMSYYGRFGKMMEEYLS